MLPMMDSEDALAQCSLLLLEFPSAMAELFENSCNEAAYRWRKVVAKCSQGCLDGESSKARLGSLEDF